MLLEQLDGLISAETGISLYELAKEVPGDRAIVEIGSYKGKSTCYLAEGAKAGNGAHVYAVDPWGLDGNDMGGHHRFTTAKAGFHQQVTEAGLESGITPIHAFSVNAAVEWGNGLIGLLFIDGDHEYESVVNDWVSWRKHLAEPAIVVFDDYDTERNPGVKKAVDHLLTDRSLYGMRIEDDALAVCHV